MPQDALAELEIATCNMSVIVIATLLDRIHSRLQESSELTDVAEHVCEALALLYEKHEEGVLKLNLQDRAH